MSDLDTLVSQAVLQAHRLERAVHSTGPWTMTIGVTTVAAQRFVLDSSVVFLADFPRGSDGSVAFLECDGVILSALHVTVPRDEPFSVKLALDATVGSRVG